VELLCRGAETGMSRTRSSKDAVFGVLRKVDKNLNSMNLYLCNRDVKFQKFIISKILMPAAR
jgi:hypothetical protein